MSKMNYFSLKKHTILLLLLIAAGSLYLHCSGLSGSGTGVGNGVIIGKVIKADSTSVKHATVRFRSETYLADTSGLLQAFRTDTTVNIQTDTTGTFVIDSFRKLDSYWIEVIDSSNAQKLGTLYILDFDTITGQDTVFLSTHMIEPLKEIRGRIVLFGLPQNAYVLVYGLERMSKTDDIGRFVITDLPVGDCDENECEYKLMVFVRDTNKKLIPHEYELEIERTLTDSIIRIELELSDTLDADDFVPAIRSTDSILQLIGFPLASILTFTDSSSVTIHDTIISIQSNQLHVDSCHADTCFYTITALIPKSTGGLQKNIYILRLIQKTSDIVNYFIDLIDD
jgi:hypothetical protein